MGQYGFSLPLREQPPNTPNTGASVTAQSPYPYPVPFQIQLTQPANAQGQLLGYLGILRAILVASTETAITRLRCDWRGVIPLVGHTVSIGYEWLNVPPGTAPINITGSWGIGSMSVGGRATLTDPFPVALPAGVGAFQDFTVPTLSADVELITTDPAGIAAATGTFSNAGGPLKTIPLTAISGFTSVPPGASNFRVTNGAIAALPLGSRLNWRFAV